MTASAPRRVAMAVTGDAAGIDTQPLADGQDTCWEKPWAALGILAFVLAEDRSSRVDVGVGGDGDGRAPPVPSRCRVPY